MLGFCLSFWYFWLVCFVLYLFVFDNRLILISNFISVFFLFWGYNFRRAYKFIHLGITVYFILFTTNLPQTIFVISCPFRLVVFPSIIYEIVIIMFYLIVGYKLPKSPSSPLLPGIGTIYVRKLEILLILTYLKEILKYCLKKCLFSIKLSPS